MPLSTKTLVPLAVASTTLLLGACATSTEGTGEFTFAQADYPEVFDATREALTEYGFTLQRIDAQSGVISTDPAFTEGFFEPWNPHQSSLRDEWADAMNRHARAVRVTYASDDATDSGAMRGAVWVTLYREHRANRRLDAEAVGASSFAFDPLLAERHSSAYQVPMRRDPALEARLATAIARLAGVPVTVSIAADAAQVEPSGRSRLIEPMDGEAMGPSRPRTRGWP